jgi:mannose-1-phosphate guanylyltransferase
MIKNEELNTIIPTRWGSYEVLNFQIRGRKHCKIKRIFVNPHCHISYQKHFHRQEVWTVINGEGLFVQDGEVRFVKQGSNMDIPIGSLHSVKALDRGLEFMEIQFGSECEESDIERISDDWSEIFPEILGELYNG